MEADMSSKAVAEKELMEAIAEQAASCADEAVKRWMAEFDSVLQDPHLTTLGRLQAVSAIVMRYHQLRGEAELSSRQHGYTAGWGVC
jgi:hypothetical protein